MSGNVDTVLAYCKAAFANDQAACARLVAPGFQWIEPARGVIAAAVTDLRDEWDRASAWTDRSIEIDAIMEMTDGAVILQGWWVGTHSRTWMGIPATGRRCEVSICEIFTFDDQGRIRSEWCYQDLLGALIQLGVVAPPFSAQL